MPFVSTLIEPVRHLRKEVRRRSSRLAEPVRRRIANLALSTLALGVFAAAIGSIVRVQESMETGRAEVLRAGGLMVAELDHDLDVHISHLRAMKYLADRLLADTASLTAKPAIPLAPSGYGEGYESLQQGLSPQSFRQIGRITGIGPVPAPRSPEAMEVAMAHGLTPVMQAITERSANVPWVHYASARKFMLIFPHAGSQGFQFTPNLLERQYFASATPQTNPLRLITWSDPYEDAAGQGRIITVTQPIYQGDTFLGSVNIDFKVASLSRFLEAVPIPKTHVHLINTNTRERIAQAWPHDDDTSVQPHNRMSLPLQKAPWSLELSIDQGELLLAALRGRMWHFLAVAIMAVTFAFLLLLTRSHRRVRAMAISDGLTGLYNRRFFDTVARHQFDDARRTHGRLCLALLDIDFFKKYNDHYGHQQGDEALKAVANSLRKTLRRSTDQVFRVGGEEFAILLGVRDVGDAESLMKSVNQAIRDLHVPHVANPGGFVTLSIGVLVIEPEGWTPLEEAYKLADAALYDAKSAGRDRVSVRRSVDFLSSDSIKEDK